MSSARKKKDSNQPELPIEGAPPPAPVAAKAAKKPSAKNDNSADHVIAETVEAVAHRPFDPKQLAVGLHTRVDRGFLDYASYVIRDRAIPNLADGLKPVRRGILDCRPRHPAVFPSTAPFAVLNQTLT
jgi:topoisomerase-4 subunit A